MDPQRTVLGLLGAPGAGKSHVALRLAALAGARVVDADALAHAELEAAARDGRLAAALGAQALRPDGAPDRAWIARRVFADEALLWRLESLLHPRVAGAVERAVGEHRLGLGPALLVLDVPLLLESGLDRLCDALWFVDAPAAVRARRLAARGMEPADAERRERRQASLSARRERATHVVENGDERRAEASIRAGLAALGLFPTVS